MTKKLIQTTAALLLFTTWASAEDLSRYREFQLDSGLAAIVDQAGKSPTDVKTVHAEPALIQKLSWRAPYRDEVEGIEFEFYGGDLFRMVISYKRANTEGMTAEDLIEAISAIYGPPTGAESEIKVPTIYDDNEFVETTARWQDADWSLNLVRSKYQPTFYVVALSEGRIELAETAIAEGIRLEREAAPLIEMERRNKLEEQWRQ